MRQKDNYIMMKMNTSKRVTPPNGRTFVAQYKRVSRTCLNYLQMLLLEEDILKELHLKPKKEKEIDKEVAESLILLKK